MNKRSTSTPDGVITNSEVDRDLLPNGKWDGKTNSYIPSPDLDIHPDLQLHDEFDVDLDPITYQVLRSRFWNMNLDHSDTVKRVSGSPVIVYTEDFNTSLLTENGDTVLCGPSIQYFTGYGDLVVKWTLENRSHNPGIRDGDAFIQNDPYIGTAHQMDVELYAPVFWEGRLFCWIFSNCHVGDIGGINPGSFCPEAPDVYSEPLSIPPMKLVEAGKLRQDVFDMVVRQSRTPENLTLQLRSQIAGLRATKGRILELLQEHGAKVIKGAMRRIIKDCSRVVSERLNAIPDGEWNEAIYMGAAGPDDRSIHRLVTRVVKQGDRMTFYNEGTDPQFQAANGTYGSWRSALICAAGTMLAYDQMYCPAGVIDHMTLVPTPGTLNCATHPAAVTTLSATIVSVYLASQVLSKMVLTGPKDIRQVANATGGVALPGWWVASANDRNGRFVADVTADQVMGSIGAFPSRDGVDTGGAWWWPRSTAGNAEDWEQSVPFLYLYRREQKGSGGAGRWRGGNGVEVGFVPHKTAVLNARVISVDPGVITTIGLAGGSPGHPGNFLTASKTKVWEQFAEGQIPGNRDEVEAQLGKLQRVSPKGSLALTDGDIWVVENSAGGGFGDPLLREPQRVIADVREDRIYASQSQKYYGVVADANGELDEEATVTMRQDMRRSRLSNAQAPTNAPVQLAASADYVRYFLTESIGLADGREGPFWTCWSCQEVLSPTTENYKDYLGCIEMKPHDVDPVMYADSRDFCDDDLMMRQYVCSACGHLIATDIARAQDEPVIDMKIFSLPEGLTPAKQGESC
jgi:N-methylhydantoinase B